MLRGFQDISEEIISKGQYCSPVYIIVMIRNV